MCSVKVWYCSSLVVLDPQNLYFCIVFRDLLTEFVRVRFDFWSFAVLLRFEPFFVIFLCFDFVYLGGAWDLARRLRRCRDVGLFFFGFSFGSSISIFRLNISVRDRRMTGREWRLIVGASSVDFVIGVLSIGIWPCIFRFGDSVSRNFRAFEALCRIERFDVSRGGRFLLDFRKA